MIENMELCTARGISNLPLIHSKHLTSKHIESVRCRTHFPFIIKQLRFDAGAGLRHHINSSLRPTTSEETSTETTQFDPNEPDADPRIVVEDTRPDEKKEDHDTQFNETPQEGSLAEPLQLFKFLEDLDIEFDYKEGTNSLVIGGGSIVALWLAAAVVGAIDSIPVVPKVLELIGLGYTIWFSSRYLIFKENRNELVARIEQIKQQVLGSKDD